MTKDQALKLALEALHGFIPYLPLNDEAQCGRYDKAITAIKEALMSHSDGAQPEQEPVTLPENKKLILVDSSFDDLMYWLERCESKGHLENCADLIEPWEKFCDSYCVWTDHHPDCKLAEQESVTWRNAAIRVGEDLCSVGPFGYYDMTAEQWLDWALSVVTVHAPPPQRNKD